MTISVPRLQVPVTTLVLGLALFTGVGKYLEAGAAEDQRVIWSAAQALAAGKAHRARDVQLRAVGQAAAARAERALQFVHAQDTTIARLTQQLGAPVTGRDSLYEQKIVRLTSQRDSALSAAVDLRLKARADSLRLDAANARIADLETNLAQTLAVAECHVLHQRWLPRCPSRMASALLGAGTAFVVSRVVR